MIYLSTETVYYAMATTIMTMADDEEKPSHIRGIHFEIKENILTVVGTDGHRLSFWKEFLDEGGYKNTSFTLTSRSAHVLLSVFCEQINRYPEHKKKSVIIDLEVNPRTVQHALGTTCIEVFEETDFPNWRKVVPNHDAKLDEKPKRQVLLNPRYLSQVGDAFDLGRQHSSNIVRDSHSVFLVQDEDSDPVIAKSPGVPQLHVVVMPVYSYNRE